MANPLAGNPYSSQYDPSSPEAKARQMAAEEVEAAKQGRRPGTYARYARMQAGKAGRAAKSAADQAAPAIEAGLARNALFPRSLLLAGSLLPGAATALGELEEGRTAGAVAAPVGGIAGAATAGTVANRLLGGLATKGPAPVRILAKGAMAAAPLFGGMIGAPVAADVTEKVKRGISNEPTAGKEQELGSQMAVAKKLQELGLEVNQANMNAYIAAVKDLRQNDIDSMVQAQERLMPFAEQFQRNQAIRQQSMINTMGQNYAMLGTLATAGKLATGAQEQTGATLRTALTSNPYAQNVLQAPSISFG